MRIVARWGKNTDEKEKKGKRKRQKHREKLGKWLI